VFRIRRRSAVRSARTCWSICLAHYAIKYERISRRRGKKRAIIAIARMILTAIYHMLSTGEAWNPCDLQQIDMPSELREKELQKSIRRAVKLLVAQGIVDADAINLPFVNTA